MFWGLVLKPNKWYSQTVQIPFHVSMASLDITTADNETVEVVMSYKSTNYLLCNLEKGLVWQVPLDLNFEKGIKISFICNGQSQVHLTGYLKPQELDSDELEEEEEDEEIVQEIYVHSKRKAKDSPTENVRIKRRKCETKFVEDNMLRLDETNEDIKDMDEDEQEEEGDELSLNEEDSIDLEDSEDEDEDEETETETEEEDYIDTDENEDKRFTRQAKKNKQMQQQKRNKKQDETKLIKGRKVEREK